VDRHVFWWHVIVIACDTHRREARLSPDLTTRRANRCENEASLEEVYAMTSYDDDFGYSQWEPVVFGKVTSKRVGDKIELKFPFVGADPDWLNTIEKLTKTLVPKLEGGVRLDFVKEFQPVFQGENAYWEVPEKNVPAALAAMKQFLEAANSRHGSAPVAERDKKLDEMLRSFNEGKGLF
jgi:hypothetical protein